MFTEILLGHLLGDYLLQNQWMALSKHRVDGLGWITCTVHCVLYTLAVLVSTWTFDVSWAILVFLSHFIIDKFSIAEWYCKVYTGRSVKAFLKDAATQEYSPYAAVRAGFTTIVYVVTDNTMHLLLMWYGWRLLY